MKKRKATLLKWTGAVIVILGIFYAILLALASRSLDRTYAALEADGRPMKATDVIPANAPDTDNAALIYKALTLRLKAEPAAGRNLFDELADTAKELLKKNPDPVLEAKFRKLSESKVFRQALEELEKGTRKAGCRYQPESEYSKGPNMALPFVSDLMDFSKILGATAIIQALDGDPGRAWDTVITGLRFANTLEDEPILVCQLIRVAQLNITTDAIQFIAPMGLPSSAQHEELVKLLAGCESMEPYVRAIDGERLLFVEWLFNQPDLDFSAMMETESNMRLYPDFKPLRLRDHAAFLSVMHAYSKDAEKPYSADFINQEAQLMLDTPSYCVLTKTLAPALGTARERFTEMIARARVTRAGLAALDYHREKGIYPDGIKDLAAADFSDPFSGKPLICRASASGFIVYSIGKNQVDDKGVNDTENPQRDIVWRYPPE